MYLAYPRTEATKKLRILQVLDDLSEICQQYFWRRPIIHFRSSRSLLTQVNDCIWLIFELKLQEAGILPERDDVS